MNTPQEVPRTKEKGKRYREFRSALAELYLLPKEELERRWIEVQKKNDERVAQGLSANPYDP